MSNRRTTENKTSVNMDDVARAAQVSKAAVSLVLNNRPGQISADTRKRILLAVRETGYRPTASSRADVRSKLAAVGFVVSTNASDLLLPGYHSRIFRPLLRAAEAAQINVMIYTGGLFDVDTEENVRSYCDGRCDGLILCTIRRGSTLPQVLSERGTPYVVVGCLVDEFGATCVDVDNRAGVAAQIGHLVEMGHRRIAFCPGLDFVPAAIARQTAFRSIMQEMGLEVIDCGTPVVGEFSLDYAQWARQIAEMPQNLRPTAIVGWNDDSAAEIMGACVRLGIRIPEELSVVGFDDSHTAESVLPGMTSYRQPYDQIAATALSLLEDAFYRNPIEKRHVELAGGLTVRGSVAPSKQQS